MSRIAALLFFAAASLLGHEAGAANPIVRFATSAGSFDVELCQASSPQCSGAAPNTVANFMTYVNGGAFTESVIHRSVPGFVIQGGGFYYDGAFLAPIPTVAPIGDEYNQHNLRGTVSMAKSGLGATSQWFVNLGDNSASLDALGFTVFGIVLGDGMQIVDVLAVLPVCDLRAQLQNIDYLVPSTWVGAWGEVPLINYPAQCNPAVATQNQSFVPPPVVNPPATLSELAFVHTIPEPSQTTQALVSTLSLAALALRRAS